MNIQTYYNVDTQNQFHREEAEERAQKLEEERLAGVARLEKAQQQMARAKATQLVCVCGGEGFVNACVCVCVCMCVSEVCET